MKKEQKKILLVFGTRPEAIKMAPVYLELKKEGRFEVEVCVTAQHREMLDQVLKIFKIQPRWDLNLMRQEQNITYTTTRCLIKLEHILKEWKADLVLVHGDTTTTFAAALASYYSRVPVGHVEAGLRTWDKYRPYPEEMNRKLCDALCDLYFAPTAQAQGNLLKENVPREKIFVTGNTVIDALKMMVKKKQKETAFLKEVKKRSAGKKIVVVTAHRRESFGKPMEEIAFSIYELAQRNEDVFIVFSVHKNPEVRRKVASFCHERVLKTEPLPYFEFVQLMNISYFLLTDSGGLQEEGPALKKPVLVMRQVTERPEAIAAGTAKLVGVSAASILKEAETLLQERKRYEAMRKAQNPYGDGQAALRIRQVLLYFFGMAPERPRDFAYGSAQRC